MYNEKNANKQSELDKEKIRNLYSIDITNKEDFINKINDIVNSNLRGYFEIKRINLLNFKNLIKDHLNFIDVNLPILMDMSKLRQNFKDFNVEKQIKMVICDARFYHPDLYYDVIFIDAAKKRNKYFLEKFSSRLNKGGTIIIDNMNLDDLWVDAKKEKKEEYDQVNKEFKEYILTLKDYKVEIYDNIGDGIAVLYKK